MINVNDIVAIGGVLVGVIGGIFGLVPYLKKKGVDTEKVLDTTQNVLEATEPLIHVAEGIPALKPAATLVDFMEKKALSGAKVAEQLGHAGELKTNEEKFKKAQQVVYNSLTEINITPTDNQKKLIDDFIQEAVNDLGHAPVSEAEKNVQLQKVQAENVQLKQKLTTIQSTVAPAENTATATTPAQPAQK